MNTDQLKTNLDEAKHRAAAKYDELKDKAQYQAAQASDKSKEEYYHAKHEMREGMQDLKDKARGNQWHQRAPVSDASLEWGKGCVSGSARWEVNGKEILIQEPFISRRLKAFKLLRSVQLTFMHFYLRLNPSL